jgi:hypothetical protein
MSDKSWSHAFDTRYVSVTVLVSSRMAVRLADTDTGAGTIEDANSDGEVCAEVATEADMGTAGSSHPQESAPFPPSV